MVSPDFKQFIAIFINDKAISHLNLSLLGLKATFNLFILYRDELEKTKVNILHQLYQSLACKFRFSYLLYCDIVSLYKIIYTCLFSAQCVSFY